MRLVWCAAAILVIAAAVAIQGAAAGEPQPPARLSETGLSALGQPFSPQYPLWTDGATKRRWVHLPPGSTIDASDPNAWDFPVGTRFWKQFDFDGRAVETRFIWRASRERWVFATYVWNADGTEALLAPPEGVPGAVALTPSKRHTIPGVTDCTTCHGTTRPGPLGFNALQLSPDRDPKAIHGEPLQRDMVTLDTLVAEGRLSGLRAGEYAVAPRIKTADPETRAALGYLVANCGSCHNGRGEISALGPILRVEELLADGDAVAARFVHERTRWQVPGVPEGKSVVIDPAAPERSALLVRMRSRSPSSQMPPLGTVIKDTEAVERLTAWVSHDLARLSRR